MKSSSLLRLNFIVVALCTTTLFLASSVGVIPDQRRAECEARERLSESVAAQLTQLLAGGHPEQAGRLIEILCERNPQVVSVGVRREGGLLLASAGGHLQSWTPETDASEDGCYIVPIESQVGPWGRVEFRFEPLYSGYARYFNPGLLKLLGLVIPCVSIATGLYFRRAFRYLDPSRVVPGRVRQTLDTFVEGVVLLDKQNRIVLANSPFQSHVAEESLMGHEMDNLPWLIPEEDLTYRDVEISELPWNLPTCRDEPIEQFGIALREPDGTVAVFSANVAPVYDENNEFQGLMIAFADVTTLEQKRAQLASTLEDLRESKKAITNQNEELRYLATRDPLTGCINRRTFYDSFQQFWMACNDNDASLSVMMVDIDFFKSINDTHGHGVGDEVLKATGKLLLESAGPEDVVCRYGGEEFAVLVPNASLDMACEMAERIRVNLSEVEFSGFSVTTSVGVSSFGLGAADPADMLEQADKCLYYAKRNGRNQVVSFDDVPADLVVDDSKTTRVNLDDPRKPSIPFPAVSALLSALSFRDAQTAAHSTRVANYAAALAQEFMSPKDVYVVETAGLLHDIGKIGVADSILLKPGELDASEWEEMHRHDVIGEEIVRKSFQHEGLTDIIRFHHIWYDGSKHPDIDMRGDEIPLGARILAIADSYDAMVSDRPYRKGIQSTDALEELNKFAGTQFDPAIVEVFTEIILAREEVNKPEEVNRLPDEVIVCLGEQIERVIDAVDHGDRETFLALADRMRMTAEQNDIPGIAAAASHAVDVASEDSQLEELAYESFELLKACRSIHSAVAPTPKAAKQI